jgi:hypothetical protein
MSSAIQLKKPVTAFGETFTQINFREPKGLDIAECGLPIKVSGSSFDKGGVVDTMAVRNLIAKLGNVPAEMVDQLSAADFSAAMGVVLGFFGDMSAEATT